MWKELQRLAYPAIPQYTCALRRRACSASSTTSTAAPSPITNPSLLASNGREACSGSLLRAEVALIASKQAMVIGEMGASVAPAITTSASPSSTSWWAWPTASIPDVQPVEMTAAGPWAPNRTATSAAMLLGTNASYRTLLA